MIFHQEEIRIAQRMKRSGLPWEPRVGHYVLDPEAIVGPPSPFQEGVYFILNYEHFMRLLGGVDRFRQAMVWLPTWEQLRMIIRDQGMPDVSLSEYLSRKRSIELGQERLELYRIAETLVAQQSRMQESNE